MARYKKGDTVDDEVKDALEMVEDAVSGWQEIYDEASKDLSFIDNQWDAETIKARRGRHCITIDRLTPFSNQVVNEIRQNTPTIKVLPVDSGADVKTAEVMQDLIRNIEQVSGADAAYDTAAEYAVKCSIGFLRIDHDYISPDTFEQHIIIKRVVNPLAVMIDPSSTECDGSDSKYGFVLDRIHKDTFKEMYPDAKEENFDAHYLSKYAGSLCMDDDYIKIAELFNIEQEEREIVQLENGLVLFADDPAIAESGFGVKASRMIKKNKVKRRILSGAEILKETTFPSSYVPLIPVYGQETWVDGKRVLKSLIRPAKDSQRMYNYWASLETELLQKAPKSPYIVAEGQTEGYEDMWQNPDMAQVLVYKQVDVKGERAPMPQRVAPPPVPTGVVNARMSCVDDIKAVTGLYDASLGNEGSERSGKAIIARQQQGSIATFHFGDNLARSIAHVGRIILDMIPRVYDTPRILRVTGEDGVNRQVMVNGPVHGGTPDMLANIRDLSAGKYDCVVTTGPSFANKRAEAADAMMRLSQANPAIAQVAGDLMVSSMDVPGAAALAKRLKKMVPPQFLDSEDGVDPVQQLAQASQIIEQGKMAIDQLQQQIQEMGVELQKAQAAAADKSIDMQTKHGEMQLKAAELEMKQREQSATLAQKQRELDIKEAELQLKASQMQEKPQTAQMEAERDIRVAEINAAQAEKVAQISSGNYIDPALTAAVEQYAAQEAQVAESITKSIEELSVAISKVSADKKIVRDGSGRIKEIVSVQ